MFLRLDFLLYILVMLDHDLEYVGIYMRQNIKKNCTKDL